jgi:hypothetical protein
MANRCTQEKWKTTEYKNKTEAYKFREKISSERPLKRWHVTITGHKKVNHVFTKAT